MSDIPQSQNKSGEYINANHDQVQAGQDRTAPGQAGSTHVNPDVSGQDRSDPVTQLPDDYRHSELYTVNQAAVMLRAAGVPRSPRTIRRYCRSGILLCVKDEGLHGEQYNVPKAAIDDYILHQKQREAVSGQSPQQDTVGHATGSDQPKPDETNSDRDEEIEKLTKEKEAAEERVKKAEDDALEYKINDAAKKEVIRQMRDQQNNFINIIREQERNNVRLEERLQKYEALEAPKADFREVKNETPDSENQGAMFDDGQSSNDMPQPQGGV